jgi:molybdopterin-guanine dinucleotide biosynthesis protein A
MSEDHISAIVLAGGRSSRFGRDKLVEVVDGQTLLEHSIAAVRVVAAEVLVVVAPDAPSPAIPGIIVIHDARPFEGPLAAVDQALGTVTAERIIVVAGDMPDLVPAVLRRLLASLGPSIEAVVLEVDARPVPLPMALARAAAASAAHRLVADGERRLRALPETLGAAVIDEATWRLDDATGRTVRDIDVPGDL